MEYVLSDKTGEQHPSGISQHAHKAWDHVLVSMQNAAAQSQLHVLATHQAAPHRLPRRLD